MTRRLVRLIDSGATSHSSPRVMPTSSSKSGREGSYHCQMSGNVAAFHLSIDDLTVYPCLLRSESSRLCCPFQRSAPRPLCMSRDHYVSRRRRHQKVSCFALLLVFTFTITITIIITIILVIVFVVVIVDNYTLILSR